MNYTMMHGSTNIKYFQFVTHFVQTIALSPNTRHTLRNPPSSTPCWHSDRHASLPWW